jgi:ATP-dependent RNA helicase HelY
MAVNLLGALPYDKAREVLETSFAQFQADRGVVGLARQARKHAEAVAQYAEQMQCHLGDFTEYAELRRQIKDREGMLSRERSLAHRREARRSMEGLRRGTVVGYSRGRRTAHAVVLETVDGGFDGPELRVLTDERQVRTLTSIELPHGVSAVGSVRIPKNFNPRNPAQRRDLASSLRNALSEGRLAAELGRPERGGGRGGTDAELSRLRERLRAHPCHGCSHREEHARWAQRWERAREEQDQLLAKIQRRTGSIAEDFDKVCALLGRLGYLGDAAPGDGAHRDGGADRDRAAEPPAWRVTEEGRWLARLYAEKDLVLAECLRAGVWDKLSPADLAAVVSTTVYEARSPEQRGPGPVPGGRHGRVGQALVETTAISNRLAELERLHGLPVTESVDLGLVGAVHLWAAGAPLVDALNAAELGAGDFVRWCKQVLDVLDQLSTAAPDARLAQRAHEAMGLVRRGVVAWSNV